MSQFVMPSLGADMESAILMEWLIKEGDTVTKGQVIAEVETSKGVIEIEVFEDGIVDKILIEEETECAVGTPLALIRSAGEPTEEVQEESTAETTSEPEPSQVPAETADETITETHIQASPAARKKAKELGIDLRALSAKVGGTIQLHDVEDAVAKEEKTTDKAVHKASAADGMRQAIAKAVSRSNTEIPHYYLSTSINMTPALEWLEALNSKRSIKERILPAARLIRAAVMALEKVPELNGFWEDGAQKISQTISPGIAISLRKGGLITPALLDAQQMNLDETMQSLNDLITRTRSGKLRGSEMTQQTVSITNLGDLGIERVYGVIYPPQVAIIGLGRITDTPWAEGDTLSVRKVLQATLAGDHRATDGRTGALFLDKLNQFLQQPENLL